MSLLDIDERIVELARQADFDRCPLTDLKHLSGPVDVGLVEGGCANEDNVRVLREFRARCKVLVSVGDCAINGGVPALRNTIPLAACLAEAFLDGPSVVNPRRRIPDDPAIPRLLDRVYPCHEVVRVDHHVPGCPPAADALWAALQALLAGQSPQLPYALVKYD